MKYWNKDKDVRRRCWHKVDWPRGKYYQGLKVDLQNEPSDGKFYMYYAMSRVWFEREEDAIMFSLKYL